MNEIDLLPQSSPATPKSSIVLLLEQYQQEITRSNNAGEYLLRALLVRDKIDIELKHSKQSFSIEHIQQLIKLDQQLYQLTEDLSLADLPPWRRSIRPDDAAWWWFLDQKIQEQQNKNDLAWILLTGTLLALTVPLSIEIIKRFFTGVPDVVSIFGTLLILLLTGSPFSKLGRDFASWLLGRILSLKPHLRTEAMTGMAFLTFIVVLALWLLLPGLALSYNNQGHQALKTGNLTIAQQKFQRAMALNPDLVVPYYNLGQVYERIARPEEAQVWYNNSIEHDINFVPPYRALGHLFNVQGTYEQAEEVLLAGLDRLNYETDEKLEIVIRYELLADLGWSYFSQEHYELAQEALEEAITLEEQLKDFEKNELVQYRMALPHYFLAQIYENLERPVDAREQWEDYLRFLETDWKHREWRKTALEHLTRLEEELQ